jgi:hypothetical protein
MSGTAADRSPILDRRRIDQSLKSAPFFGRCAPWEILSVSIWLMKAMHWKKLGFRLGYKAANLFNDPNYVPPNTTFTAAQFGTV